MLIRGWRAAAPAREAGEIDAQVADGLRCHKCQGPIHHQGFHRFRRDHTEHLALAVCDVCRPAPDRKGGHRYAPG
jgi:hypothetical protein